ncbi:SH3 domain-binding glutamic acid-rich-like protein 3 [Neolamprologus brichardi]|uniref:SH3 domain-binding glutamic acid-rich-like protein 3 n=1 Tax=Neolamprologus brichardi TaxID=32507 RepID=UPI001643C339|nr:SH3 domain-binding glutamic acid-rich-like protein 3 [Neolamprologus brichardi]
MPVKVFFTSVSGSTQIKKNQERVFSILNAKKILFQSVDISQSSDDKDLMRQGAGDPTALPPQIFNGDVYCGDISAFDNAIEMEQLEDFLKL